MCYDIAFHGHKVWTNHSTLCKSDSSIHRDKNKLNKSNYYFIDINRVVQFYHEMMGMGASDPRRGGNNSMDSAAPFRDASNI